MSALEKTEPNFQMTDGELCLLCQANNKRSYLHSYQINLDEAIVLCENPQCSYPIGSTNYYPTYSRSFSHIEIPKPKDVGPSVPEAQMALQTRMAGYARANAKVFKSVIGTQTDKRPNSRTGRKLLGPLHLLKSDKFPVRNDSVNGPLPNGTLSQWYHNTSKHSKTVQNLNSVTSDILKENGHVNSFLSNPSERASPSSSADSTETKIFAGFRFSMGGNLQKKSKSEPPLDKLKTDILCIPPHSYKPQIVPRNAVKNTVNGNVSNIACNMSVEEKCKKNEPSISLSGKLTGTERKWHLKQAKTFFSYPDNFIQWRNSDALCWLDAVQCLLVHNRHVHKTVFNDSFDKDSVIYKLVKAHKQAQELLQTVKCDNVPALFSAKTKAPEILAKFSSQRVNCNASKTLQKVEMKLVSKDGLVDVKTGAGIDSVKTLANNVFDDSIKISDKTKADQIEKELVDVREHIWQKLQPKLKFERGRNDSPVFTMSSLIRDNQSIEKLFKMNYSFWCQCSKCGYTEQESFEKVLPTLPMVVNEFKITEPSHSKTCSLCGFTDARRTMVFNRLSDCLLMHFMEGLPHSDWTQLDFDHHGNLYTVTGVVQYVSSPDHFIAWLRDPTEGLWMRCDDLLSPVCTFQSSISIPQRQIHMVMWEKVPVQPKASHSVAENQCLDIDTTGTCTRIQSYSGENQNSINSNCVVYTAVKVPKIAHSEDLHNADIFDERNHVDSHVMPASGGTSVNSSHISIIQSGRNNVPKEHGSSSLSSACSELSEDLPDFAAVPPNLAIIKPVPCHTNITTNESKVLKKHSETVGDLVPGMRCEDKNNELKSKTDNVVIKNSLSSNTPYVSTASLTGQKSEIKPSTVFCKPDSKLVDKIAQGAGNVVFPPYCVQNIVKPGENSAVQTLNASTVVQSSAVDMSVQGKENLKELNDELPPVILRNGSSRTTKTEKFRFTSAQRMDKSLFTYMRRKMPIVSAVGKDKFMTLNLDEKSRSQVELNHNQAASTGPLNQMLADGSISFLGKVQQYLLNNKINCGDTKFDGLKLKTNSETLTDKMLFVNGNKNSLASNTPCSGGVISPMSEWFGRKVNSSPKSTNSSIKTAVKRKSTEIFSQTKKVLISTTGLNGHTHSSEHTRGNRTMEQDKKDKANRKIIEVKPKNICIEQSQLKDDEALPVKTDCVLQDLYEALNIPFEDVGSTMSSIMSDVDDILDLVKPADMTSDPGAAGGADSRNANSHLVFTNGHS